MGFFTDVPLSLDDIHAVAGGTRQSSVTLDDADVRGLRASGAGSSQSGSTTSFSLYSTAAKETYVIGNTTGTAGGFFGYAAGATNVNDIDSDSIADIYPGYHIEQLTWTDTLTNSPITLILHKLNANVTDATNAGWDHIVIGTTSLFRAEATFTSGNSGVRTWKWFSSNYGGSNPFTLNGDTNVKIT